MGDRDEPEIVRWVTTATHSAKQVSGDLAPPYRQQQDGVTTRSEGAGTTVLASEQRTRHPQHVRPQITRKQDIPSDSRAHDHAMERGEAERFPYYEQCSSEAPSET